MGVAKTMGQTPLFSIKTLAFLGIQPSIVFHLVATLCENGGTLEVMVRSKDTFVLHIVPHPIFEANRMEVLKVQLESWHVVMAKLHDLLAWRTIDRASVILRVVVVHNEEGMVQLRGASTCQYWPLNVLLDFGAQPLMLGKATIDGFGLTNANFDQCPYHILTSMGELKKARGLMK